MKRIALLITAAAVSAAIAVPAAAAVRVTWADGVKKSVTIGRGGSVTFVWGDSKPHNMYGGASAGTVTGRGRTATRRFTRSTTVYCAYHRNMYVRVNVR